MELDFTSHFNGYDKYEETFLKIAQDALKMLKCKFDPIISITLVDNDFIHKLNKEYRNIDRETDVISFAFLDSEEDKESIINSDAHYVLGDIYISLDKATSQAKEIGNTLDRELRFLFTHGLLHLLGYDHMKPEDEKIMFDLQDKILGDK